MADEKLNTQKVVDKSIEEVQSIIDGLARFGNFVANHVAPPSLNLAYCHAKMLIELKDGESGELRFESFDVNSRFEVIDENGKQLSPSPYGPGDRP